MKLKNIIKKQSALIQLKLIKTKAYKKKDIFTNLKIEGIEYKLKKGLQVIYKYHVSDKKILFVGNFPSIEKTFKNLLKKTRHVFVSDYLWSNGVILNKQSSQIKLPKSTLYSQILKLKNRSHLIVILNNTVKNNIIVEYYKAKIPIIFLDNPLYIFDAKFDYKIPGNFIVEKTKKDNLFIMLLKSILKRSTRYRYYTERLKK